MRSRAHVESREAPNRMICRTALKATAAIAGEDRKWYWADAHIDGNTVVVSSLSVLNPKAVRYAWQSNPAATLFNGAGLPAAPFRTDPWPGVTEEHRPY
jgi:sialate O-acetylesterase